MNFLCTSTEDYILSYTRTELTNAHHEAFSFRMDYEIVLIVSLKEIFGNTKNKKST